MLLAALGWGTALLSGLAPSVVGWFAVHVPGGGLLRDGSRFLALAAPLVVVLVAAGAQALVDRVPAYAVRTGAAVTLVVLPLLLLPDLAAGASGRLQAVDYPPEFDAAADVLATERARGRTGDVLLMPFSSYRAPSWNPSGKVIDPSGRYVASEYVTNDALAVSGREVEGEDPRARQVEEALATSGPDQRARELRALGISHVVRTRGPDVDRITGPRGAPVPGEVLLDRGTLQVVRLEGAVTPWEGFSASRRTAVGAAWVAYGASLLCGLALLVPARKLSRRERSLM